MFSPENIQIKHSARARSLQLKVTHYGEVIVVVPKAMRRVGIDGLINKHRPWIEEKLAHLESQRVLDEGLDQRMPDSIELPALSAHFQCHYAKAERNRVVESGDYLHIHYADQRNVPDLLQQWLQTKARKVLLPWLEKRSEETGLNYNRVTIRGQKTRWGSCTARGNINLNRNLLFLSPVLVSYLMLHELCHTRHLNHSRDYWNFVSGFENDFRRYENELSHAYRYVPVWAAV